MTITEDALAALGQESEPEEQTPESLIAQGVIPEGYTKDRDTGEIRPKKRRGRQGSPPPGVSTPLERGQDEPPDGKAKGRVKRTTPRYQKGVIQAGMTKLYKRTGRIVRAMDKPIGIAILESAEDCGEAWDELARTNPNVRRVLMRMISGGAWGAVIMAHAPIFMAIVMRDGIRKHIPFMKLINSFLSPDEDGESELSEALGGFAPEDVQQMMNVANGLMQNMAQKAQDNGNS